MIRFLVPKLGWGGWSGDGMRPRTSVEGRCIEFSWLGLHVALALCREKSW